MRTSKTAVVMLLLGACNSQGTPAPPTHSPFASGSALGSAAPSPAPMDSARAAPTPPTSAAPAITADPRCPETCLFLATMSRASAAAAFQEACGMEASLASELDCDQLDYERHCIRAAHGLEIKDQLWADAFRALKWYQPRADRSDKDLGRVAVENIAQLEQLGRECRRTLTIEKKLASAWTKTVLAGKPDVPAVSFDCISESEPCKRISLREMRALLLDGPKWTLVSTPDEMRRMPPSAEVSAAFRGRKLSGIDIGFEGHCAVDEGCPRAFRLVFDAQHKFVAIERLPVAACPFVYSLAGAPEFEGEILRNLNRPSLERDDSLAISARTCSDVARFRISEEKDEVTSLDAVSLLVDGVSIAPSACATGNAPYCVNDGRVLRLARGEHLDLTFRIPSGAECDEIELRANGHYTPLR